MCGPFGARTAASQEGQRALLHQELAVVLQIFLEALRELVQVAEPETHTHAHNSLAEHSAVKTDRCTKQ